MKLSRDDIKKLLILIPGTQDEQELLAWLAAKVDHMDPAKLISVELMVLTYIDDIRVAVDTYRADMATVERMRASIESKIQDLQEDAERAEAIQNGGSLHGITFL